MILGGLWFMLAALTAEPDQESGLPPARLLLVGGALATAAVCVAPVVDPSLIPDTRVLQIAAGAAAGGYLVAAIAFGRAWHLLRLPSQAAMTLGTSGFAFGIVAMAGGGLPAVAGWQFELMMLCFGALPAAGFLVEQRTRPGLRAMVLGLLLPGAAASMSRGYPGAMHRLLDAIEDYDPDLRGHVNRVAALAIRIGMRMRLNASHLREVALAAQLHDVGKIAIPRTILMKASSLTAAEFAVVQRHAAYGEQIVARLPGLSGACRGVGEHHERWDGAGYPYAREGHGISLTARIVAVADVYDALVSKRTYKEGWDRTEALAEIVRGAGSRFDPRVVDELLHVVGETEQVARAVAA
jgi:HD-GYP domain-containing protein (c-di-GMP phosphodiesterase class II)